MDRSVRLACTAVLLALSATCGTQPTWSAARLAPPAGDAIIAEGDPPLTASMVTHFTDFMEWALEAPMTQDQRDRMRAIVTDSWQNHRQSEISTVTDVLKTGNEVAALPPDQRALVRARLQPALLQGLRQEPDNPDNQWLLQIYDSAHAPIAAGTPPLTRQMSDSLAEMFAFMMGEVSGQPIKVDARFRDDWAAWLVRAYPGLPADRQAQWSQSPMIWAALRVVWRQASVAERSNLRQQWNEALKDALPLLRDRAELANLFQQLQILATRRQKAALQPAEMDHAAGLLSRLAVIVRKDGGESGAQQARQIEQAVRQLKQGAAEQRQQAQAALKSRQQRGRRTPQAAAQPRRGGKMSAAEAMRKITQNHENYMSMMNMSMTSFYSRMNSIQTMGGSPYRYVNSYGNPY